MNKRLSRRKMLAGGVAVTAGTAAAALAARFNLIPPDATGIYGVGETLTYAAQRVLMSRNALAREFSPGQISKAIPVNGDAPFDPEYQQLVKRRFVDWRLTIDGLVARPSSFSLTDLKSFPARTQITHLACEEGWSYIAEWTGVPLFYLLTLVGAHPKAKYVAFFPYDESWDSLDAADAWHPQTLLAYGMNGGVLPTAHGAPLRLRVARQLGYKSVKYLSRITVTDSLKEFGAGLGSVSPEWGYSWFAGI